MRTSDLTTDEDIPVIQNARFSSSTQSLSSQDSKEIILATSWLARLYRSLTYIKVTAPKYKWVPLLGCVIILLNDAEFFFKQTAMFRAIEALYCIEYYDAHGDHATAALGREIPEAMCKKDSIEQQVAKTYGWIMFCRMLPCVFTAVLLGILADRVGRKVVLCLHKIGTIVFVGTEILVYLAYPALPIWTLYVSAFGAIIGANFELSIAMLFASYTDVIPSASQRASLFFVTTSMQYVGQAFFPILAGRLINLDGKGGTPEVSLYAALGTAVGTLAITFFLFPETMRKDETREETRPLMESGGDDDQQSEEPSQNIRSADVQSRSRLRHLLIKARTHSVELVSGIGSMNLLLLVISMLGASTAIKSIDMIGLVQYPVVKLSWTFSDVTFVTSIQAFVYIFNYMFVLPACTGLGNTYSLSPSSTSLLTMIWQALVLTLGSILIGISSRAWTFIFAMAIYTLGTGLPTVMQSYISNLVDTKRVGRVLSALSVVSVVGKLLATSLGPFIFGVGIRSGNEEWKGLLFFFSAILFVVAGIATGLVAMRVRREKKIRRSVGDGELMPNGFEDETQD